MNKKITIIFLLLITFVQIWGDESNAPEQELSLADILNMKITTGSFLELDISRSPLSMTIITHEMIKNSGARNMSELIEIYVPGFIYNINKWNGTVWGMRGVINDRNTKIIYLVNGHKMNTQSRDGFQSETVLGMLEDIERVEVLRGPAGIVYGSGAIAGIINVVTRKAEKGKDNIHVSMDTDRSKSIEANIYSTPAEETDIAITAGYRVSEGMPTGKCRIYGHSGWPGAPASSIGGPSDGNLGSTDGNWKVGVNLRVKNINLYGRTTRQKESAGGWFIMDPWPEKQGTDPSLSPRVVDYKTIYWDDPYWKTTESYRNSLRQYLSDNFMLEGKYEHFIGVNNFTIKLGYDLNTTQIANEKRERYFQDYTFVDRVQETFGESRFLLNTMFLLNSIDKLQLATGIEYRRDHCGNDIMGQNMEEMNPNWKVISDVVYNTFTFFTEGFYDLNNWIGFHGGGRIDKHTRATMINPKFALVLHPTYEHSVKFIYQTSSNNGSVDNYEYNRYHFDEKGNIHTEPWISIPQIKPDSTTETVQPAPTLEELHSLKPEKVYSLELAYVGNFLKKISFEPSISWGKVKDLFGWSQELFTVVNVGQYQYINLDLDAKYKTSKFQFGINHTFQRPVFTNPDSEYIKKLMYKIVPDENGNWGYVNGFSSNGDTLWWAHFDLSGETSLNVVKPSITYDGKDFTSLPTNMTKLYLIYTPFKWCSFFTNMRIIWGVPGRKAVLEDPKAVNTDKEKEYNYFGFYGEKEYTGFKNYFMNNVSKKWNAGVNFFLPSGFTVSLYAYNILGIDRHTGDYNKDRYTINTLRLAQMYAIDQRNLYSMDQQALGIAINKQF